MSKDKTLGELAKEYPDKTYNELDSMMHAGEPKKGVCITGALKKDLSKGKEIDYHRYWKDMYEKEHKLRQEAQGETTIVKGIGMNSPEMKDAEERIKELQIRLGEALEIDEAHKKQMGKLQARLTEVEEDNKKLSLQIEDLKMNHVRKAGL